MAYNHKKITRRDFLKHSAIGTVGATAGIGTLTGCAMLSESVSAIKHMSRSEFSASKDITPMEPITNNIHSTVSVAYSPGSVQKDGKIDQAIVQKMFDQAIFSYTGKDSIEGAWDTIIPGLKSTDTIGLKINCINPSLPTHPEVVNAIITHLLKIGLNENNIMVWDRHDSSIKGVGNLIKSGYKINSGDKGVRYISTSMDNIGYDDNSIVRVPSADIAFPVSKILSRECKYLINVPQLRSHARSGVTQCMKNYYGVIPIFGPLTAKKSSLMHENNCNLGIPELYNNLLIKEKTVLHVSDALLTIYEGGPMGNPQDIMGKLLIGKDPVAIDSLGLMMIEEGRNKLGLETVMRHAKYIQTAAEMGLGTNNSQQINVRRVNI